MSNRSDLFEYVSALTEEAAGAVLAKLGAAPASTVALTDTFDGNNGSFAMLQVTNPSWSTSVARFIFKNGSDSLPPGSLARATAEINEIEAMSRYNSFSIPAIPGFTAHECEQCQDETTGLPGFRIKREGVNNIPVSIPHVFAVPPIVWHGFDLRTAQGLTDCLNWLPPSSSNTNLDFSPHH
jgi:hypothetical protein